MIVEPYLTEMRSPFLPLQYGSTDYGVSRVQEWLTLHGFATAIDGDFGPATRAAVTAFQRSKGVLQDDNAGVVDTATWGALVAPLVNANALQPMATTFGDTVVRLARAHLREKAREVGGDNRGTWVRHYCRGHSVAWCQGFASTIWLDAARMRGMGDTPFRLDENGYVSLYVPWVAESARRAGKFVSGSSPELSIPTGSMFFVPGRRSDGHSYLHVGIVVADEGDTIATIEGNTNTNGSSNGYEVAARYRRKSSCDYGLI